MDQAREVLRTLEEQIQPIYTALLIVDVQNDFVHPDGLYGRTAAEGKGRSAFFPGSGPLWDIYPLIPRALTNLKSLLNTARDTGVLIVFVRAIYDPPYISPPQQVLMERHGLYGVQCRSGTFGADFFGDIRPRNGGRELVVTKHRWSGFAGTDLDQVLRSNGIKTLLMTGTATSICVESTARDGLFNDYYVVTVEDCCADRADDRQSHATRVLSWGFGFVTTKDEVQRIWAETPVAVAGTVA